MQIGLNMSLSGLRTLDPAASVRALFANDEDGVWYDTSDISTLFQDNAGTTPITASGQTIGFVRDKSGNGLNATQATTAARPSYIVDADGAFIQHDPVDDALTVTLPDMGTAATVAYVTRSEVRLLEDQTLNGSYTLPTQEIANFVAIDRALTFAEKVSLIRFLAAKVEGVNYGAEIDRLTLIAINAVDVFVYDTSKDSDGGAWRTGALAQASSWYNEELNTATRGSRREFPAVAVIVAGINNDFSIYDGDDPALPLWAKFNHNGSGASSVTAKNGSIAFALGFGLAKLNLIADELIRYTVSVTQKEFSWSGFNGGPYSSGYESVSDEGIVSNTVNDVAMTVLPDAPIDPATGLPVPTIAVATAGGVSVITDSGDVWDTTVGFTPVREVAFDAGSGLWWYRNSSLYLTYATVTDYTAADGFGDLVASSAVGNQEFDLQVSTNATALDVVGEGDLFIGGTGVGRHYLNTSALVSAADTHLHAYTTSTYNTGWQVGSIKGAFLSDTDDTDLVGATYLDDDFTSYADQAAAEAAGYEFSGCTFDAANDQVDFPGTGTFTFSGADPSPSGEPIIVKIVVSNRTKGNLAFQAAYSQVLAFGETGALDANGTYYFSCTSAHLRVLALNGFDGSVDSVTIYGADADRSVNNNGLTVNGTVTRTPVATGADLVAYSGFSSSNYLEQPYNSALDFGTGDFCVMGWVKDDPATTQLDYIFSRSDVSLSGEEMDIYMSAGNKVGTAGLGATLVSSSDIRTGEWKFVAVVRKNGFASLYVDGLLEASAAATTDLDNTSAVLRLGGRVSGSSFVNTGFLALWRISATAPTAEQITKIYEDEKVLFQENAQATLYGTSDAVTALAHDPDTDLLHVGTSAGRSVFDGLRRVGNTATSVSTAISASGGLIVEK